MMLPDRDRVAHLRGWLVDLALVIAHGIAGMAAFGVVRFLGRTLERLFADRDVALPGMTQLMFNVQSLLRTYWYLLPLLLVADLGVMRFLRRKNGQDRPAAGYSTAVLLMLILSFAFAVLGLVHPLAMLVKSQ